MDQLKDIKPWSAADIATVRTRLQVKDGEAIDRHRLNHVLADWPMLAVEVVEQYWLHKELLLQEKLTFSAWEEARHVEMRKALIETGGERASNLTQKMIAGAIRKEPKLGPELAKRERDLTSAEVVAGFLEDLMRVVRDSRDTIGNLSHNLRAEYQATRTEHDTQERHDSLHSKEPASSSLRRTVGSKRRQEG